MALLKLKYISPSNIENLLGFSECNVKHGLGGTIRFTQPDALNDPFEMERFRRQHIEQATPDILTAPTAGTLDILRQITAHPTESPVAVATDTVQSLLAASQHWVGSMIRCSPVSMFGGPVGVFQSGFQPPELGEEKLRELQDRAKKVTAEMNSFGILSLTTHDDNLLMWAHYADEHRGAVVEIDVEDEAFCEGFSRGTEAGEQADEWGGDVGYPQKRPRPPLTRSELIASFFQKSAEWKYEIEYRVIRVLSRRVHVCGPDRSGFDICLFRLPASCIKRLILGARFKDALRQQILQEMDRRPELRHIRLEQATLDLEKYGLKIEALNG